MQREADTEDQERQGCEIARTVVAWRIGIEVVVGIEEEHGCQHPVDHSPYDERQAVEVLGGKSERSMWHELSEVE